MQFTSPEISDLGFLQPYVTGSESFSLSTNEPISIQKYLLTFSQWSGDAIPNTYNGKAVIDWNGEPVFAELAVLRLFQFHGWSGVWVDSYRRKYRTGLPDVVEPVSIPEDKQQLLDLLREKTGRYGGCWDVCVWNHNKIFFLELKLEKKDAIRASQISWLEESLKLGLSKDNFAFVEWKLI